MVLKRAPTRIPDRANAVAQLHIDCGEYSVVKCTSRRSPSIHIREVFARNLRRARSERSLSQEALAHDAGVDRTYISALERGVYGATIDMIDKLARVLEVEPSTLLERPMRQIRSKA